MNMHLNFDDKIMLETHSDIAAYFPIGPMDLRK